MNICLNIQIKIHFLFNFLFYIYRSFNLEEEFNKTSKNEFDNGYEVDSEDDMPKLQKYTLNTLEDTEKWKQISQNQNTLQISGQNNPNFNQKSNRKVSFSQQKPSVK